MSKHVNASHAGLIAPVERLVLVDELVRSRTGLFQAQSLPGHLLHFVESGIVRQSAEGRAEVLKKGAVVWYHESEPVRGRIVQAPWRFITVSFIAPALPPPPDDRRVLMPGPGAFRLAQRLLELWRDTSLSPLERQTRCHVVLLELLLELLPVANPISVPRPDFKVWWRIEKSLRSRLEEPLTLANLKDLGGCSVRTLTRACKAATGLSPMRRLKELRLGYARGLVQHSEASITDIAFRVGYRRSQEFSRDYRKRFGLTPRADRIGAPSYREWNRSAGCNDMVGRDGTC